jgi:hypothetical protein
MSMALYSSEVLKLIVVWTGGFRGLSLPIYTLSVGLMNSVNSNSHDERAAGGLL